jgi:hypothetical protein
MKNFIQIKTTLAGLVISSALLQAHATGWVTWDASSGGNGHQYMAVGPSSGLTWNVANQIAQNQGAYLATITSAAENNFVFGLINSSAFFTSYNGSGPAIGGYQPAGSVESGGGWSWVTGEAWNYTNWLPGTPNGGTAENNLEFFSGTLGHSTPAATWNDIGANDTNLGGYVMERVVPEPSAAALFGAASLMSLILRKSKKNA